MANRDNFLWKIYGGSSTQGTINQIMPRRWGMGGRWREGVEKSHKYIFQQYENLSLIVIKSFQKSFMFSFHVNLNLDILFEKLTAQIGVPLGLGT